MRAIVILYMLHLLLNSHASAAAEETEQECSAPSSSSRREATVIMHSRKMSVEESSVFEKKTWGNNDEEVYFIIDKSKKVYYVPNFLNETTAQELQSFCLQQDRFVKSPVRSQGLADGGTDVTQDKSIRTSESCTMVPAATYLKNPRFQAMQRDENPNPQIKSIIREVDVTWDVSNRAASLLQWDPPSVEPLQIVRYTSPDAFYNVHHDHGDFYGKQQEHRPWTVLVFLNDVPKGGHTYFPKLDLRVVPRGGDAIAWSNVVVDGKADPDMVHAGEPPAEHGVEKYAVNIWLGESSSIMDSASESGVQWGATDSKG